MGLITHQYTKVEKHLNIWFWKEDEELHSVVQATGKAGMKFKEKKPKV